MRLLAIALLKRIEIHLMLPEHRTLAEGWLMNGLLTT